MTPSMVASGRDVWISSHAVRDCDGRHFAVRGATAVITQARRRHSADKESRIRHQRAENTTDQSLI